jgi:pyruvate/2-oxoglutarate dehydrogenase complex dihydrolipoamide dehydrogenase (E3) component
MTAKRDLVVIGGGPGGLVVASVAAQLGLKVTLAEKSDRLGGDCLHHGCVPSKTLIRSARIAHLMRNGARYGLPSCEPEIDLNPVMDRVESVIADIQRHDDPERFRAYGCEVRFDPARFTGPHEVRIGDEVVAAKRCVIATGSQPAVPPIPGLQEAGYDTNETIFKCRVLPPRLAVLGAGPVGVELAQAFARLGSRVTLIEQSASILPAADADIAECLAGVLRDEGIKLQTGAEVTHVRRDGDCRQLFLADGSTVECERLLVATGRQAGVFGLGLDAAGVDHTPRGIAVDRRLRTSQRHIYAVGDVCGPYPFTHMAEYQAGVVLANLLFRIPRKVDYRVVPRVTYSDPEVAQVGLSQHEADASGLKYDVARFAVGEIDRARTDAAMPGFAKILIARGRIAGASLVGAHAGELVHELALAMRVKAKARDITELVHAYPTYSQIHRRAINARYSQLLFSGKTRFLVRMIKYLLP